MLVSQVEPAECTECMTYDVYVWTPLASTKGKPIAMVTISRPAMLKLEQQSTVLVSVVDENGRTCCPHFHVQKCVNYHHCTLQEHHYSRHQHANSAVHARQLEVGTHDVFLILKILPVEVRHIII